MKRKYFSIKQLGLFLAMGVISTSVYANTALQSVKVTVNHKNAPISKVLDDIEQQTGYSILVRNNDINIKQKVTVNVTDENLNRVLDDVFKGMDVKYDIENKTISIYKPKVTSTITLAVDQNKKTISGVIVDPNGEPVIGANILEKGTKDNGTISDIDGKFSLNVEDDATLLVSFVGFKNMEIPVKGKNSLKITMANDTELLDEVVVVGYMTQKKSSLTGAVANMKMEDNLTTIPTTSASNLLAGKMAGVNISSVNGIPGENPNLSIRTVSSWKDNPQPVTYVIDGVVRDATEFNNLSANEIDDISVLKDAASAAIYGSRSSGGVVIVTTKKGLTGKPTINYSYGFSVDTRTKNYELTDGVQTALIYNRLGSKTTGGEWTQEEIDHIASINDGYGYNQLDEIWQNPTTQTHNFSISGGNDKLHYFGAASYIKQQGFLDPLTYDKYNIRMNVTANVTKDFELFTGFALNNDKQGLIGYRGTSWKDGAYDVNDSYGKLRIWQPEQPVFTDSGKLIDYGWVANMGGNASGYNGYCHIKRLNPSFIVKGTYKMPFLEGLSASVQYSKSWTHKAVNGYYTNYDMYITKHTGDNGRIISTRDEDIIGVKRASLYYKDYIRKDSNWGDNQQFNFYLNYHNTFNDVHRVDAVVLTEWAEDFSDEVYGLRETFPFYMTDQFWAAGSSRDLTDGGGDPFKKTGRMSYVGQFNYSYADKYLLSFSFREDGSMNFAPKQRWGFFPAGSLGWVLSEESFFNKKYVQFLKLRGSVGLTGDDSVGGWQWQESYVAGGGTYFGKTPSKLTGMGYGKVVNPNLTWEKALSYNVGVDANFLDHWTFSGDYWFRKSYDILDNRQATLPTTYSREMPAENYGKMNAQGIDLQLGYRGQSRDFTYFGNFTMSYGWNEIKYKDYAENAQKIDIPIGTSTTRLIGYEVEGILRTQEQLDAFNAAHPGYTHRGLKPELGMLVYKDHSGPNGEPDGIIDGWDRVVLRNKNFPVVYGLNLGGSWKGLSIDMMFSGELGKKKSFRDLGVYVEWNRMWAEWYDNSWTPENPNAMLPKQQPYALWNTYGYDDSAFWLKSTNYIRLKYLTVSYDLPKNQFYNKLFDNVRLFVTGSNLFCWSHFKYYDPELATGNTYPIMRSFNFGIDVKF